MDGHSDILGSTYIKRAHQLVKKGRAVWVSADIICLLLTDKEDFSMEPKVSNAPAVVPETTPEAVTVAVTACAPQPQTETGGDAAIRDLAKRRLAAKRGLVGQALDFLLIVFVLFLELAMWNTDAGPRELVAFLFVLFWGIRLLVRVLRFARPSFSGGFAGYRQRRREQKAQRKEQKLAYECNRIKKMGAEYVSSELGR